MRALLCSAIVAGALTFVPVPVLADPGAYQTDVGLLTAIVAGTHIGAGNPPVSGIVPGAALEITQHVDRLRIHLEGIPTVTATGENDGPFGHSSASLDLLNATMMVDVDPRRRFRIGAGYQLINLTNKNADDGTRNAVRIGSPILAAGATLPFGRGFFELNLMDDPNLRGTLLVYDSLGGALPNLNEQGAEVDYSAAYGWRRGRFEYLIGGRGLSYHTKDPNTGALVDRNVGGGLTFELRYLLGK